MKGNCFLKILQLTHIWDALLIVAIVILMAVNMPVVLILIMLNLMQ